MGGCAWTGILSTLLQSLLVKVILTTLLQSLMVKVILTTLLQSLMVKVIVRQSFSTQHSPTAAATATDKNCSHSGGTLTWLCRLWQVRSSSRVRCRSLKLDSVPVWKGAMAEADDSVLSAVPGRLFGAEFCPWTWAFSCCTYSERGGFMSITDNSAIHLHVTFNCM